MTPTQKKRAEKFHAKARKQRGIRMWQVVHQFEWRGMTWQAHRENKQWHITGMPTMLQYGPDSVECAKALRAFKRYLHKSESGRRRSIRAAGLDNHFTFSGVK